MRVDLLTMMIDRDKFPKEVNDVLKPIISELQPDIKNFTRLIETLLDISKVGDKSLTLFREDCDITAVVKDETSKLKPFFDSNHTELIIDIQ